MFKSPNYTQIFCKECGEITHIYPDVAFDKLKCKCERRNEDGREVAKTIQKRTRNKIELRQDT